MSATQKSFMAKKEVVQPGWYILDGDAQIVGRLATKIATVLMGKHKPSYTPHVDCGDYVIVTNADRVRFSGRELAHPRHPYFTEKMLNKRYERYTGYPGGQISEPAASVWESKPEKILHEAVRRMLPKSKMGRAMIKKLKLYSGDQHPHQAQQPQPFPAYLLG